MPQIALGSAVPTHYAGHPVPGAALCTAGTAWWSCGRIKEPFGCWAPACPHVTPSQPCQGIEGSRTEERRQEKKGEKGWGPRQKRASLLKVFSALDFDCLPPAPLQKGAQGSGDSIEAQFCPRSRTVISSLLGCPQGRTCQSPG